ncbi:unnamed protein product [Rotaria magnacalcarata]|uniref:G domain-containing protein n=2 Tax=Rotaria magnacalcarata TaxID=392030 RepID=A0A815ZSJ2_9BILA|nr:unnamed protein product [Rotaria magnacalcarata]CAF2072194.1 unnamed protein product [Rotaria magnacalcarata]CAF4134809.1 unnamed protein product [Rotaria magnacalcarata]CAF4775790.1 unnamed protein product [Rotaria magnacalcarata]
MSKNFEQSNILICGSPRVGKSTLINAICRKQLSKSYSSLSSSTKTIDRYSSQSVIGQITHETNFWDTPGIESWKENDVRVYMASLIETTNPLCMIYCASPGSFAILEHVAWMVSECHRNNIFCALVCTHMWMGRNRQNVVDEFCKILNTLYPQITPTKEDGIIYYDRIALVTMVNSTEHVDEDFGVVKPPLGVDELIFGIAKCLKRDFMVAWFRTVSENKSFWTTMSSKLSNLLKIPYEKFNNLVEHTDNFLDSLLGFPAFDDDYAIFPIQSRNSGGCNAELSSNKDSNESIFYDAEIIDMPSTSKSKILFFTLKSKDMMQQFNAALVQFGAREIRNRPSNEPDQDQYLIEVKFEDENNLKAVHDFWQVMNQTEATCKMVDNSYASSNDDVL